MDIVVESLWIAALSVGFLAYAGLGIAVLLASEPLRSSAVLIAPWVGYAVTVTIAHWCGWLGWSIGQTIVAVLILSTLCNLWGLLWHRGLLSLREHLGIFCLTAVALAIALYPIWHMGFLGPVSLNGDPVLYSNVAAHFDNGRSPGSQSVASAADAAWQPALLQLTLARDYGLPYGFSYLHAIVDRLIQREAHETFAVVTAVALALAVPVYACLARGLFGASRRAALLAALLAAVSPTLMWVHYNGYAMHVTGLGLLPLAFGSSVLAWQQGFRARLLAALLLSAAFVTYSPGAVIFTLGPLLVYVLFRSLCDRGGWFGPAHALGWLLFLAALANLPGIVHAGTFVWHLVDLRFATQFGDVANHVDWSALYGLAPARLSGAMAPQWGLSALSITVAAAAAVMTLVGLWRSIGTGSPVLGDWGSPM